MKILLKQIWFLIKKFPLTSYGILFFFSYVFWIISDLDTNKKINLIWKILMLLFAPLIALLIKINELLLPSCANDLCELIRVILIITFFFLVDLWSRFFHKKRGRASINL